MDNLSKDINVERLQWQQAGDAGEAVDWLVEAIFASLTTVALSVAWRELLSE